MSENFEMLKALYDFQAVYPKTISFEEGEHFILYQSSARQRNWWQVVNIKGNIGFVPSNYVMKLKVEPNFLVSFLDSSIESLKQSTETEINGIMTKQDLIQKLKERKYLVEICLKNTSIEEISDRSYNNSCPSNKFVPKKLERVMSSPVVGVTMPRFVQESCSLGVLNSNSTHEIDDDSITPATSELTRTTTSENFITFCNETKHENESYINNKNKPTNDKNISPEEKHTEQKSSEICKPDISLSTPDVYQIVDIIRRNTNLNFELSCEALRIVLSSLEKLFPKAIDPYLEAVAVHLTDKLEIPPELLGETHDAKRLRYIFSQLAICKNDSEQRTWMLYEDEEDIIQFLEELVDILKNADENVCCHEMSCDQYQSLVNLVQYYQMETRWPIKELLLKAFIAACHLDHVIVDILLTSVLPLEIVEDMKRFLTHPEKFKQLTKMLTIIFSLGQAMPVNHQEHIGVSFVQFLLDYLENNQSEALADLVVALILAFNLQFVDFTQNIVIEAMQNLCSAKIFTEKILLLLNREEDPVRILKHSTNSINSVLKIFVDLFSSHETASIFYTNDNKVLMDIIVRQLSDLSAGDPMRRPYLELCRRILRNTNYKEHTHRKQDLMKIFTRIFCEETECSAVDQQLVREIANEFPEIFKA